jgi:short-subunit dehydrogenase
VQNGLDILINNAGVYINKNLVESNDDELWDVLSSNLVSPIILTRELLPIFQRQNGGIIVNINSTAGEKGTAGETLYCASKFGLRGFSEALLEESRKYNIQVLSIFLGAIRTKMVSEYRPDWEKLMDPNDVAKAVCDVCTEMMNELEVSEIRIIRGMFK